MKTMKLIIVIGILSLSSIVKAGVTDYIITGEGINFYNEVRIGITGNLFGLKESDRVSIKANEVLAYRKDGRIYERMPVVRNNKETNSTAFMELVTYRNGLKVYRHANLNLIGENEYLVFKNNRYVVCFDQKNYKNLNGFFCNYSNTIASK